MIAAVVLAAGRSARLGLPKPLLPAGPNETLLTRAVATALAAVDGPVFPVLGAEAPLLRAELRRWQGQRPDDAQRLRPLVNPRYAEGLSTSLRAGVAAVGDAEGALVLLTDQPGVDALRVGGLVARFRARSAGTSAMAASWDGEQRTPVVLGRELFGALGALAGDQGARRVLRERPDEVTRIDWGAGPWQTDIDTWDDYVAFARHEGWDREASEGGASPHESPGDIATWSATLGGGGAPAEGLARFRRLVLAAVKK